MQYPKIETLFDRDDKTFKVIEGQLREPEFGLVSRWLVTEKIDGTNVRVFWEKGAVRFGGRTDNSQMPTFLLAYLQQQFTPVALAGAFDEGVRATLFGEGYGPKIQKGGGNYRDDVSFRLIDVVVYGEDDHVWWLTWDNVVDVAAKLSVETVPVLGRDASIEEAIATVKNGAHSQVAFIEKQGNEITAEGIVCRTDPPLFTRRGHRVAWKLKTKDFAPA